MNKKLSYYYPNLYLGIVVVLFDFLIFFSIREKRYLQIDMIERNLVIMGFLFTALGIIVSVLSNERIERLNKYGYLKKYYMAIYISLYISIISVVLNYIYLYTIFFKEIESFIEKVILLLTIDGFLYFIQAIYYIKKMLKKVSKPDG